MCGTGGSLPRGSNEPLWSCRIVRKPGAAWEIKEEMVMVCRKSSACVSAMQTATLPSLGRLDHAKLHTYATQRVVNQPPPPANNGQGLRHDYSKLSSSLGREKTAWEFGAGVWCVVENCCGRRNDAPTELSIEVFRHNCSWYAGEQTSSLHSRSVHCHKFSNDTPATGL